MWGPDRRRVPKDGTACKDFAYFRADIGNTERPREGRSYRVMPR